MPAKAGLAICVSLLVLAASGCAPAASPVSFTPTVASPAPSATPAPTLTLPATRTPTAAPSPTTPKTPTQTAAGLTFLAVEPLTQTFPAGSTVAFNLRTDPTTELIPYHYWVEGLPSEITAHFLGSPAPYQNTLLLDTPGTLAPGSYAVRPAAEMAESPPVFAQITLNITSCTEFHTGVFTQSMQSNLILLITSGKPDFQHGLLVPLQVCASNLARRLRVTLEAAVSEAGTPMTTPPPFYIFRSLTWPAPDSIQTHDYWAVNATKLVDSKGQTLEHELTPGLWLLVFERDRFGSSPDPEGIPAIVTYRVEVLY